MWVLGIVPDLCLHNALFWQVGDGPVSCARSRSTTPSCSPATCCPPRPRAAGALGAARGRKPRAGQSAPIRLSGLIPHNRTRLYSHRGLACEVTNPWPDWRSRDKNGDRRSSIGRRYRQTSPAPCSPRLNRRWQTAIAEAARGGSCGHAGTAVCLISEQGSSWISSVRRVPESGSAYGWWRSQGVPNPRLLFGASYWQFGERSMSDKFIFERAARNPRQR